MININQPKIEPMDFYKFLNSMGWKIVPEAVQDGIYLFNHPDFERRQVMFPSESSMSGYMDSVQIVLDKLSEIHNLSISQIINSIHEIKNGPIFICSVEKLMGEIGSDNRRQGEVILNLYHEDEVIKAKAYWHDIYLFIQYRRVNWIPSPMSF